MSKNLQHFVNNFVLGMQLGDRMQDRRDLAKYRKDSLEVARQKATQSADQFRIKAANDAARTQGYLKDVEGRYIKNTTPKAGKAGPAGPTPAQDAYYGEYGAPPASTQPQSQNITVEAPDDNSATPMPAGVDYGSGGDDGYARGGKVRQAISTGFGMGQRSAERQQLRGLMANNAGGTTGPGSGMGAIATAPPTALNQPNPVDLSGTGGTYRRGGAVRRFAEGGPVVDYPDDASRPQSKWDRDRAIFEAGQLAGRTQADAGPSGPEPEPQPGGDRPPSLGQRMSLGATPGGQTFGGSRTGIPPAPPEAAGPPVPDGPSRGLRDRLFGHADNPGALDTGRSLRDRVFGHAPPPPIDEAGYRPGPLPADDEAGYRPGPLPADGEDRRLPSYDGAPPHGSQQPTTVPAQAAPGASPRAPGGAPGASPRAPGGAPAGRGAGALDTSAGPWKPLRDQTRTAAYDPQKDLYDPDNVHATATPLAGATSYADRVFHQGEVQGQGGGQGDAQNASLAQRGKVALYSGTGAADPKLMQQIFQKVDPDNRMTMEQRMTASVKAVHDFYTANGDTANADKSAFEVAQFANRIASEHGKEALKLMQAGNVQGATDMLVKGYNFLPDGHNAAISNGQIVITDAEGKVAAQYPVDQRSLTNIAMGMASGQLNWDVMRNGGALAQAGPTAPPGGPPAAAPPPAQVAAQPAAAPAGPSQTPAAPATVPPAATASQGSPAPQLPASPSAPAAAPARPSPPAPSGGAPVPSSPATRPAAPTSGGAPSAAARPAGETKPPTNPPGVPSQGDDVRPALDTTQGPGKQTKIEVNPQKIEQDFYDKRPFSAPPGTTREQAPDPNTLKRDDVAKQIAKMEEEQAARDKKNWETGRRAGVKPADIKYNISRERKELDDKKKALLGDLKNERTQQAQQDNAEIARNKPRDIPVGQEENVAQTISTRTDALAAEAQKKWRSAGPEAAAADQASRDNANSPLRWMQTPKDKEPLNKVATGIWRYNHGHSLNTAIDDAASLAAILRPGPDGKMPTGYNYQQGKNATVFKRMPDGPDRTVMLEVPTPNGAATRTIRMDRNTYGELVSIHQQNWKQYTEEAAKAKQSKEIDAKGAKGIETLIPKNLFSPSQGGAFTPPERGQMPY